MPPTPPIFQRLTAPLEALLRRVAGAEAAAGRRWLVVPTSVAKELPPDLERVLAAQAPEVLATYRQPTTSALWANTDRQVLFVPIKPKAGEPVDPTLVAGAAQKIAQGAESGAIPNLRDGTLVFAGHQNVSPSLLQSFAAVPGAPRLVLLDPPPPTAAVPRPPAPARAPSAPATPASAPTTPPVRPSPTAPPPVVPPSVAETSRPPQPRLKLSNIELYTSSPTARDAVRREVPQARVIPATGSPDIIPNAAQVIVFAKSGPEGQSTLSVTKTAVDLARTHNVPVRVVDPEHPKAIGTVYNLLRRVQTRAPVVVLHEPDIPESQVGNLFRAIATPPQLRANPAIAERLTQRAEVLKAEYPPPTPRPRPQTPTADAPSLPVLQAIIPEDTLKRLADIPPEQAASAAASFGPNTESIFHRLSALPSEAARTPTARLIDAVAIGNLLGSPTAPLPPGRQTYDRAARGLALALYRAWYGPGKRVITFSSPSELEAASGYPLLKKLVQALEGRVYSPEEWRQAIATKSVPAPTDILTLAGRQFVPLAPNKAIAQFTLPDIVKAETTKLLEQVEKKQATIRQVLDTFGDAVERRELPTIVRWIPLDRIPDDAFVRVQTSDDLPGALATELARRFLGRGQTEGPLGAVLPTIIQNEKYLVGVSLPWTPPQIVGKTNPLEVIQALREHLATTARIAHRSLETPTTELLLHRARPLIVVHTPAPQPVAPTGAPAVSPNDPVVQSVAANALNLFLASSRGERLLDAARVGDAQARTAIKNAAARIRAYAARALTALQQDLQTPDAPPKAFNAALEVSGRAGDERRAVRLVFEEALGRHPSDVTSRDLHAVIQNIHALYGGGAAAGRPPRYLGVPRRPTHALMRASDAPLGGAEDYLQARRPPGGPMSDRMIDRDYPGKGFFEGTDEVPSSVATRRPPALPSGEVRRQIRETLRTADLLAARVSTTREKYLIYEAASQELREVLHQYADEAPAQARYILRTLDALDERMIPLAREWVRTIEHVSEGVAHKLQARLEAVGYIPPARAYHNPTLSLLQSIPIEGGAPSAEDLVREAVRLPTGSRIRRILQGVGALAEHYTGVPAMYSTRHPITRSLYEAGIDAVDARAQRLDTFLRQLNRILQPLPTREERILAVQALEGKIPVETLRPRTQQAVTELRVLGDQLLLYADRIRRPGDEFTLFVPHLKAYVPAKLVRYERPQVLGVPNKPRGLVTLTLPDPNNPGQTITQTQLLPFQRINPGYRDKWYHHAFDGQWAVVNHARIRSGAKTDAIYFFNTVDEAVHFLLTNRTWFDTPLRDLATRDPARVRAILEEHNIAVVPRFVLDRHAHEYIPKNVLDYLAGAGAEQFLKSLRTIPGMPENLTITAKDLAKLVTTKIAPPSVIAARSSAFLRRRTLNLEAYIKDPAEALPIYIRRLVMLQEGKRIQRTLQPLLDSLDHAARNNPSDPQLPMLVRYWTEWAQIIEATRPTNLETQFDAIVQWAGGRHAGSLKRILTTGMQAMAMLKLSGLMSALVNLTQVPINLVTVVGVRAVLRSYLALTRIRFDPEVQRVLHDSGIALRVTKSAFSMLRDLPGMPKNIMDRIAGTLLFFFDSAEKINVATSVLAGYYRARAAGHNYEEAVRFGKRVMERTQFRYGVENLPPFLRHPISRFLFQFKPYLINEINFVASILTPPASRHIPGRIDPRWKELTRFALAIGTIGGLTGFPLVAYLDRKLYPRTGVSLISILDSTIGSTPAGQIPVRGIFSLVGADVSQRIGLGPDIDEMIELATNPYVPLAQVPRALSPVFGYVTELVEAMNMYRERRDEVSADRVLKALLPIVLSSAYEGAKIATGAQYAIAGPPSTYRRPGDLVSYRQGGKPTGRVQSTSDIILKALGAQTIPEAQTYHARTLLQGADIAYTRQKAAYMDRIETALRANQPGEVNRLVQEALSRGIPITHADIIQRGRVRDLTLAERQIRGIPQSLRPRVEHELRPIGADIPYLSPTLRLGSPSGPKMRP